MLSKLIVWPVLLIVWIRSGLAMLTLFWIQKPPPIRFDFRQKQWQHCLLGGCFLCIHWYTYFKAVDLSGVTIGLCTLFTFPMMTACLEPIVFKFPFKKAWLIGSFFGFLGVLVLVYDGTPSSSTHMGAVLGLVSALAYTIRNLLSKPLLKGLSAMSMMKVQSSVCFVIYSIIFGVSSIQITDLHHSVSQWVLMVLLGTVFTGIAHTLFVQSLTYFSASFVSIVACLQPVLGSLLGLIILGTTPQFNHIVGGSMIVGGIVLATLYPTKRKRLADATDTT